MCNIILGLGKNINKFTFIIFTLHNLQLVKYYITLRRSLFVLFKL